MIPSAVPMTPWISPSARKVPRMVRRPAPRARNMPMSRRRSATTVRKVLKMMKPPMSTAMTPSRLKMAWATSMLANSSALVDSPPS